MKKLGLLLSILVLVSCAPQPTPDLKATETAIAYSIVATLTAQVPSPTSTPVATATLSATSIPTATPKPTATPQPTLTPTSTPEPTPTNTPEATDTPEPTPTPPFEKWTSEQVIKAFKAAGLEAEEIRPMTKDDYGMAPMTAVEGTRFLIPSLCSDCGGRVFSFASPEDLEMMKAYYVELGRVSAIFFSWVFVKDNILVQINGDLPEEKAKQYEAALDAMGR